MSQIKSYKCPNPSCKRLLEAKIPYPSEVSQYRPYNKKRVKCKRCETYHELRTWPDGTIGTTRENTQKTLKL